MILTEQELTELENRFKHVVEVPYGRINNPIPVVSEKSGRTFKCEYNDLLNTLYVVSEYDLIFG